MSGQKGGVQTKLKQIYPYAIYIHCMAHKLNLVIVDTCKYLKVPNPIIYYLFEQCFIT